MNQLNNQLHQQYHEEALSTLNNLGNELADLYARYSTSVLGDMERRGVIQDGPGASLSQAINRMEIIKQSL